MTVRTIETNVYFTVTDDGKHLATSVCEPCFAVSSGSFEEAKGRVGEILTFHAERLFEDRGPKSLSPELTAKLTRTVRPFAPSHVERFSVPDCVAA